jgi:hypothetical protein
MLVPCQEDSRLRGNDEGLRLVESELFLLMTGITFLVWLASTVF